MSDDTSHALDGLRCLLINPALFPTDLRGESHARGKWKSERAINFGLLVIASHLAKHGAEVTVVDLEETPDGLVPALHAATPHLVGIGNISCYGLLSTLDVISACRAMDPSIRVVVGGQNAALSLPLFQRASVQPDWLVAGSGEEAVLAIGRAVVDNVRLPPMAGVHGMTPGTEPASAPLSPAVAADRSAFLLYDLWPQWRAFFPLIEESRGCPFSCSFCANEGVGGRNYLGKSPDVIVREIERARALWGCSDEMPVVLMCANFGTHPAPTREFLTLMRAKRSQYRLLAAMRVDGRWAEYVALMGGVFDQIHFGLESGSPTILGRMGKAHEPHRYLSMAEQAFKAFHDQKIHVGCNFILGFPGENGSTVTETMSFLLKNRDNIDSLWGGALIEYPGSPFAARMDEYSASFGTRRRRVSDFCDRIGAYPIDPSSTYTHEQMAQLGLHLMKLFNGADTFYEHYRWYPGPRPSPENDLAFYGRDEFYDLFLEEQDGRSLGYDPMLVRRPASVLG